jgi:acid phosphatase
VAWRVDTVAPDTSIAGGPSGTATSDTATFTLGSTEAGSTFTCTLDAGVPSPCPASRTYTALPEGSHTLTVAATDAAGNTDATAASRTWSVDLAGGTTLFSDGFESGNLSAWSTVATGGDGTAVVQGTVVKTGAFAAQLTESGSTGSLGYARQRFGVPRTDVTASGDFQVTAEGTGGNNVPLLRFYDSVGSRLVSVYRLNLSKNQLGVSFGGGFFTTTGTLPLNTWGQISLHVVSAAPGASTIEVKLNGTLIYRTTTATIGPSSQVQIGNETARQAGSAIADNVTVADTAAPGQTANTSVPAFDHIFVVVMENKAASQIIGSSAAPYLNGLASANGYAATYKPITHPSLPNYLALAGASTFGITTDCNPIGTGACPVSATNLADTIEASGRTWRGYFDAMPLPCTTTSVNTYVVRHNPFIYFDDIRNDDTRCVNGVVPFSRLATDLASISTTPSLALIVPDKCNDMHDCPVSTGDAWLQSNLAPIFSSPAWTTQNSLLVITFDEDDESVSTLGTVATILVGPSVRPGTASYAARDHYSLVKTIEQAWGLPMLSANDAAAKPLAELLLP